MHVMGANVGSSGEVVEKNTHKQKVYEAFTIIRWEDR